jgi:malate dehydrogenase (decarboxylating)
VFGKKVDTVAINLNLECLHGNMCSFWQVLIDNIKDFAPIIYTPTVGLVCENYSGLFRRPRGMYFSAKDKGEMMSMIYNWPAEKV